jgi:hypothetical protein
LAEEPTVALTEGWAWKEMRGARLDTPRRLPNLVRTCEKLFANAGKSLSAALGDDTRQAAFDLFSRSGRQVEDLLSGHVAETAARCRQAAVAAAAGAAGAAVAPVYVVQDSVRLDYFTHRACQGLGPVGASPDSYGLWGHSALAVDARGVPLGVLALRFWTRKVEEFGQRHQRHQREADAKETRIWSDTLQAVDAALPPDVPVILVQDRGADLYPFFVQERRPHTDFVVRAYHSRRARLLPDPPAAHPPTAHPPTARHAAMPAPKKGRTKGEKRERGERAAEQDEEEGWVALPELWSEAPVRIAETPVLVSRRPASPKKPAEAEREAQVEVRSVQVEIARPQTTQGRKIAARTMVLWAVWVREPSPPAGEEGISWLLLTTLPAGTPDAAQAVVEAYERRWIIERLHRVLKSGLRVERFQVDDAASLQNVLAVCWVVAWQLLRLTEVARREPEAPAEAWLAPEERAVLGAQFGRVPRTLAEALRLVARFGGWPGATRKMMPGTDVLWRGFRDLAVAVRVWRLARSGGPAP